MKVAREGTIVGGTLLAMCWLTFGAVAFEAAPAETPSSTSNSLLPEFLDSARLPELQDAWRSTVTRENFSGEETPAAAKPAGGEQPVRQRAEELSGRFSDGASAGAPAGKSAAKPDAALGTNPPGSSKEPPTDLSEAAMPAETPVMSHMGAPVGVPAVVPPGADDTTTATLPDVATGKPPPAEGAVDSPTSTTNKNSTWLKVGLPPLPVRSPKATKAHARALGSKSKGATAKATEKSSDAKSTLGKVAAAKAADKDDEEMPVRQFRPPGVPHVAPAPRSDPGRKEVFPPYLGAYGWQPKVTN